jgi:hypothetical protein
MIANVRSTSPSGPRQPSYTPPRARRRAIGTSDRIGLLAAPRHLAPLIEGCRGHQAAAAGEGFAEHAAGRHALGAGVDRLLALRVRREVRQEPPAQEVEVPLAALGIAAHNRRELRRGQVVVGGEVRDGVRRLDPAGHQLGREAGRETAAHSGRVRQPPVVVTCRLRGLDIDRRGAERSYKLADLSDDSGGARKGIERQRKGGDADSENGVLNVAVILTW